MEGFVWRCNRATKCNMVEPHDFRRWNVYIFIGVAMQQIEHHAFERGAFVVCGGGYVKLHKSGIVGQIDGMDEGIDQAVLIITWGILCRTQRAAVFPRGENSPKYILGLAMFWKRCTL